MAIHNTIATVVEVSKVYETPAWGFEGDVFYNKSQFKNLRGVADDVKANISVQPYFDENNQVSLLYYGHIFVNGANGKAYKPVALPAVSSMAEVLEQFNGLTPQMIEQLKIEGKNKK